MKKSFLSLLLFIIIACTKSSGKDTDYEAPVLTLDTPADNQVFTTGQDIMIAGMATDNKFIDQIHVVITNLATGTEYLHIHIHPNSNAYHFNQLYTPQAGISYRIQVIVDDGATNSTAKSVDVSCN